MYKNSREVNQFLAISLSFSRFFTFSLVHILILLICWWSKKNPILLRHKRVRALLSQLIHEKFSWKMLKWVEKSDDISKCFYFSYKFLSIRHTLKNNFTVWCFYFINWTRLVHHTLSYYAVFTIIIRWIYIFNFVACQSFL